MSLTKNTKDKAQYQQWVPAELTNDDILGITESLGHPASHVTIESIGGSSIIRFNVGRKIFKSQEAAGNNWIPDAAFHRSPIEADEIEDISVPNIIIESGNSQTWTEFPVDDIKIISKSTGLKITVS